MIVFIFCLLFGFWPTMNRENDDDAYFYGPILFLKRGDFGGTLRSWREIAIICISENWTHSLSLSPFEFIVLRKKVKNDLTKVWKWGTFFYYYLLSISLNIFQICELFLTHLSLWSDQDLIYIPMKDVQNKK